MMKQHWDNMTHNDLWMNKAIAFLARSRQELWGKHNEEILAWFFLNGFKNSFIQDMLLGWNKRPKERLAETWGFSTDDSDSRLTNAQFKDTNLFFPPGIVIPYVVAKHLEKLIIYDHEKTTGNPCYVVPGSNETPVVFGKQCQQVAVVENIVHGLLLFQEFPDNLTVVVPDESPAFVPIHEPEKESQPLEILYFPDPLKDRFSSTTENRGRIDLPHSEKKYSQASELVDIIRHSFFTV
ncbi:MAG: hypothetical protein WC799_18365 [Desulfobacteraceae bacterium]|jgi:hypothetical protein